MPRKILVVDDDPTNRKLIVTILSKKGFEAIEAGNGVEAFNVLANNPDIDIILLDIIMPVMDGITFLKEIKSRPDYINLPIIILTTDDSRKTEALALGANDVIIKPIRPVMLIEKLQNYLQ